MTCGSGAHALTTPAVESLHISLLSLSTEFSGSKTANFGADDLVRQGFGTDFIGHNAFLIREVSGMNLYSCRASRFHLAPSL